MKEFDYLKYIKNNRLLKEDASSLEGNDWMNDSINGQRIGQWVCEYDYNFDSINWVNEENGVVVTATPGEEGANGIRVGVISDEERMQSDMGIFPGSKAVYSSFNEYKKDAAVILKNLEIKLK